MSEVNWKNKYQALKAKFMESVDTAFRLGYEQGAQEAQTQSVMQQQQQQADQMNQDQESQASGGDDNGEGQSGEQVPEDTNQGADSVHPGGSELDQHISKLESMVKKGEMTVDDLMKAVNGFRDLQKSIQFKNDLKKSHQAISGIAKALHKPKFKISQQANHNMNDTAKKAVSMQEKIVTDIMKSWEEEEKRTSKDILSTLGIEGLTKKD